MNEIATASFKGMLQSKKNNVWHLENVMIYCFKLESQALKNNFKKSKYSLFGEYLWRHYSTVTLKLCDAIVRYSEV